MFLLNCPVEVDRDVINIWHENEIDLNIRISGFCWHALFTPVRTTQLRIRHLAMHVRTK